MCVLYYRYLSATQTHNIELQGQEVRCSFSNGARTKRQVIFDVNDVMIFAILSGIIMEIMSPN